MNNFINYLNAKIQEQISLGLTKDDSLLTGYRNIKSDMIYQMSKSDNKDETYWIIKLAKERESNIDLYKNVNQELYLQELTEYNILLPFIPKMPNEEEIFNYFNTLNINKIKSSFKKFKDAGKEKFGIDIDSQIILKYINN